MNEVNHQVLAKLTTQTNELKEITKKLDTISKIVQDLVNIQKEQYNFFVAVDKREMGMEDTNALEYLTELKNDGFNPPTD